MWVLITLFLLLQTSPLKIEIQIMLFSVICNCVGQYSWTVNLRRIYRVAFAWNFLRVMYTYLLYNLLRYVYKGLQRYPQKKKRKENKPFKILNSVYLLP